jgi:hypothetical protein
MSWGVVPASEIDVEAQAEQTSTESSVSLRNRSTPPEAKSSNYLIANTDLLQCGKVNNAAEPKRDARKIRFRCHSGNPTICGVRPL